MCRNGISYFKELYYIQADDNLYLCRIAIPGIVPIENNAVASSIIKNLKVLEPDKTESDETIQNQLISSCGTQVIRVD